MRGGAAWAVSSLLLLAACAPPPNATNTANETSNPTGEGSPSAVSSPVAEVSPTLAPTSAATPSHAPILQITSASFHAGEIGVTYASVTLAAAGGVGAYTWSISAGSLPAGLTVSPGGVVSGTPTAAGTASFTVHVADRASGSAIVNRSIAVAGRLSATALCATRCNVEVGCTTVCGRFGTLSNGVGPFRYAVSGGTSLPPGMGLSGLSATGPFPPAPPGALPIPYAFAVTATDSFGVSVSVNAVFYIYSHLTFLVTSARCVGALSCATSTLQYTGGTPGTTPGWQAVQVLNPNLQPEPLPKGFTVTFKGPSVIVTVPTQASAYQGTVTLILIDPNLCAPSTACPSTGNATVTISV